MAIDWTILHWIRAHLRCRFLDTFLSAVTHLGDVGAVWIAAAVLLLLFRKTRKQGLVLAVGLLGGLFVGNLLLKNLVARPRPCWLDPAAPLLISVPKDYSFPSGHTLSSTIAAVVLTGEDRRYAWAAVPLAVLIAFSRLYLYVHFPSDVLGGALLGLGIGLLTHYGAGAVCRRRAAQ